MKTNILDYIEDNLIRNPQKIVFCEKERKITYSDYISQAKSCASYLVQNGYTKKKIAIYIDRSIECLVLMLACVYANCIYCVMDVKSPINRMETIFNTLEPDLIVVNSIESKIYIENCCKKYEIVQTRAMEQTDVNEEILREIRTKIIDVDPVYILFTSGSTGIPKGTVINHRSIIAYIDSVISVFELNEKVIFGNQVPFYFSMSILDIYASLFVGGTLVIIPKMFFSFPVRLIKFMNDYKINIIYWVPTALNIVANKDYFSVIRPTFLEKVLFAGEVMPIKQLNYWIHNLSNCLFANLYGPTEITDTGTYYIVDRKFDNDETLPIGKVFPNVEVLLVNDNNEIISECSMDTEGEICFRGSLIGNGYYNNWDKTNEVFVQNPANCMYKDNVYRTGDIGKYNERGELLYVSRKDFQIKKSGYRIELGEIEANVSAIENIDECVCIYANDTNEIVLYYTGSLDVESVKKIINTKLVKYMIPNRFISISKIPKNANGKYDREKLLHDYMKTNI